MKGATVATSGALRTDKFPHVGIEPRTTSRDWIDPVPLPGLLNLKCLTMPPRMELSTLVKSFIVFLKLFGCLVAVRAEPACSFEEGSFPAECDCQNYTLTCDRTRLPPPTPAEIPHDVRDLTISGYGLGTLNTTALLGGSMANLTRLSLARNGISYITDDSFGSRDFPVLRSLSLEDNDITLDIDEASTEPTVIGGLSTVKELDLRNALDETFFKAGNFSLFFERATFRLRRLVLSGEDLTYVNPDIFSHRATRDLESLDLSGAGLTDILEGTFTHEKLPNLRLLNLSSNRLETIKNRTLEEFDTFNASTTRLDLSGNPFVCGCHVLDFVSWLESTELVVDKDSLLCRDTSHIVCTDQTPSNGMSMRYVYTLSIISAVIGILAVIILYLRRNDIWQFCLQVRQATKEAFDSHQTHYQYSGIHNARRETADSGVASVDV